MSKIFIHLGAHKTATSFIQANLTANAEAFGKQGWRVIRFHKEFHKARKGFAKTIRASAPRKENSTKHLGLFFKNMRKEPRDIFLSYEGFLGSSNMQKGQIYPNHAAPIKVLKKRFRKRQIQIGFCIRNFADLAESSYNSRVLRGRTKSSFDEYIEKISIEKLSWLKIIEQLSDSFGAENLVLWTFEDFKKDGIAAFAKIVQSTGVDTTDIAVKVTHPKNVSLAIAQIKALSAWNKTLHEHFEVSKKDAKVANKKFRKFVELFPHAAATKGLLALPKRRALNEHYERELAEIRERWGDRMLDFTTGASENKSSIPQEPASAMT